MEPHWKGRKDNVLISKEGKPMITMLTIVDCEELQSKAEAFLTERENSFLDSLKAQLNSGRTPSPAQKSWYENIKLKYSPDFLEKEREWGKNWSNEHRETAKRVANYYSVNPPYFENYVSRINLDPHGFKLSKREWDKFCENKYAKKILQQYDVEEKFKKGDCVQLRASNRVDMANEAYTRRSAQMISNRIAFVLECDSKPIVRIAKGSRVYKILLSGDQAPIYAHESDLKSLKRGALVRK